MATIFEEFMARSRQLAEGTDVNHSRKTEAKKISCKKLKIESRRIFIENDLDELEPQFNVDPEAEENEGEVVLVIDPEIPEDEEVPEDAAADMIGDAVYKCPICGSNYVCNCGEGAVNEDLEVDEEGTPIACPVCGEEADQILIGEIAPADEAPGEETDLDPVDPDEGAEGEDGAEDEEVPAEDEDAPVEDEDPALEEEGLIRESDEDEEIDTLPPVEDIVDDTPAEEDAEEDLVLEPNVEIVDSDVEVNLMFDDARFESMMTKMIRENYKGAPTFKTGRISCRKGKMKIEYVVREGKKVTRGVMIGEGFDSKKRALSLNFRDKGAFTESFGRATTFKVECVRIRNKIIPSSMSYDYKVKVNESLYRVKGTVGKK